MASTPVHICAGMTDVPLCLRLFILFFGLFLVSVYVNVGDCCVFERCRPQYLLCLNSTVNLAGFLRCDRLCLSLSLSLSSMSVILWYVKTPYLPSLSLLGLFPEVIPLSLLRSKHTHTSSHCMSARISNETINGMPRPRRVSNRSS